MKKNSIAVHLIVFILGVAVLGVAFVLLSNLFMFNLFQYIFSCINVSLIYLAFFVPFISGALKGNIEASVIGGTIYYRGLMKYCTVSVANIVLGFVAIPLNIAIVIQGVALFVFVLWVIMANATKDHLESTYINEEIKKSPVMELRSYGTKLIALSAQLDKGNSIRIRSEKIAEDMRYLSPGNTVDEHDLEHKMLTVLDSIIEDSYFLSGGNGNTDSLEDKFRDFDVLYRERKNMR